MDISTFISWFVSQTARIFTYTYTTLNNITFAGTSLLKVIIFINVIIPFIYVIITIPNGANGSYREGYREGKAIKKAERKNKG